MPKSKLIQNSACRATLVALALFTAASPLHAQQTPPFNGIAHVAIRVSNLDASRSFYQKLGFEEAFTLSGKDGAVNESFIKLNDRQYMELYPVTSKDPQTGFLHLCFEGADLQAIHDEYAGRGMTPTPVRKAGAGNLLFTLQGPAQPAGPGRTIPQNIEYTQYMPGSRHTEDTGKHLGQNRVADKLIAVSLAMQDTAAARDFYINQLHFKPIAGDQMVLHMPGESGQEVEIAPASIGTTAHLTLHTESLGKAGRHLHKEGVAAVKNGATLTVTDPDGNVLLLESR